MPFIITKGLGIDGTTSATMLVTQGYGEPGAPAPQQVLYVNTLYVTATYLDVIFSMNIDPPYLQAGHPDFWVLTTTGDIGISATAVEQVSANTVRVYITEAHGGDSYRLTMPLNGLKSVDGHYYNGAPFIDFVGAMVSPVAAMAQAVDARTLRVIYSEAVREDDALVAANYQITSPTLSVRGVRKETDSIYVLSTDYQDPGTSYTLTIYNVRDLANNPV
jgi:hypothetical protein